MLRCGRDSLYDDEICKKDEIYRKKSAKGEYGMKRILTVLLILIMVFAFTACGNNGENTKETLEILQSGTFKIEGNGVYEAQHLMVLMYVDGGNIIASFRNDNDTPRAGAYQDGKYYIFDEPTFLRAEVPEDYFNPNVFTPFLNYDFSTAVYKKSGKQEITGETLRFDRYAIETVDGEETLLEIYYAEGNRLYGIAFPNESIAITVANLNPVLEEYEYTTLSDDIYTDTDVRQIELLLGV